MPSLNASRVQLDPNQYRPIAQDAQGGQTQAAQHPPATPEHLQQSTIMISSLPSIATSVDGVTRQFYGSGNLPKRRLILPS